MNKITVTIEFEKEGLSHLTNYLIEDLRAWNENGFESREEKEQFERIVSVVSKLRKELGENAELFL